MNVIYVLGHNGMLGRYTYRYLLSRGYDVVAVGRAQVDATRATRNRIRSAGIRSKDVVINCIGAIKHKEFVAKETYALVNGAFPHILAAACNDVGCRLIHVTTDCVFDGLEGNYDENHYHNARDAYGMSKSIGEPEEATVIRTSIIGEEVGQAKSLVEWIKSNKGKEVNGFTNHHWNGITCLQFAKVCEKIIEEDMFWAGVKHIVSPTAVNKMELVQMVSDVYGLGIMVNPFETPVKCDRTLSSVRDEIEIEIPELLEQIEEMKKFGKVLRSED